jgi:hypothetical protein
MELLLCALAAYKLGQMIDALTPREAMPWVKLIVATLLSYGMLALAGLADGAGDFVIKGLAISAVAGTVHTILRALTLMGDRGRRTNR